MLLAGAVLVAAFARRRGLSAPLAIVIVAAAVSYIPGVPDFEIEPEIILTLVLPPLLYSSALNISVLSFRKNLGNITQLGVVLVFVTALVAGCAAFIMIPDMTWPAAVLLGAIVAPPDAVSAAAVGRKLGLPRRLMTVLLGESLINDATSLTMVRVTTAIIAGSALSFADDVGIFSLAVVVGIGLGFLLGFVFNWVRRWLKDPVIESLLSLLLPFFAYVAAEHLGGSGVLAVVVAGLYVGYHSPTAGYQTRLQEQPLWRALDVLLEGLVFALIGLQLHTIIDAVAASDRGLPDTLAAAVAVFIAVVLVRPAFILTSHALARTKSRLRERRSRRRAAAPPERSEGTSLLTRSIRIVTPKDSVPRRFAMGAKNRMRRARATSETLSWREVLVLSWSGMRGVVTLAAAIAVPSVLSNGEAFPAHDTVVFIAFFVTMGTLLLQGLTLPAVVRLLKVSDSGRQAERDRDARRALLASSLQEATAFVKSREGSWRKKYGDVAVDQAITTIRNRLKRIEREVQLSETPHQHDLDVKHIVDLRRQVIQARRLILLRERDAGTIDEELMQEVMRGIDAEELALDTSLPRARE